ncbi:unnamed protein product [marine sediment metagenome]|uniref:Uncharacterized protein n=1 Tax=marine sediment metagenome TaxID=412755 RepID=X0W3W7_9ZZZZ
MVFQREDHAVVTSHRLEKPRSIQKTAIGNGYAGLGDVNQLIV